MSKEESGAEVSSLLLRYALAWLFCFFFYFFLFFFASEVLIPLSQSFHSHPQLVNFFEVEQVIVDFVNFFLRSPFVSSDSSSFFTPSNLKGRFTPAAVGYLLVRPRLRIFQSDFSIGFSQKAITICERRELFRKI